jgi:hypothetical protein
MPGGYPDRALGATYPHKVRKTQEMKAVVGYGLEDEDKGFTLQVRPLLSGRRDI